MTNEGFRQAVTDIRSLARWLRNRGAPHVGVMGMSLGGYTSALVATVMSQDEIDFVMPMIPLASIATMANHPSEQAYPDLDAAIAGVAAANPAWPAGDVRAKAEALVQVDVAAARAVVLDNGDWDGGLSDLADPAAAGIDTWLVRGDPAAGGLVPDAAVRVFVARLGRDHVLTIAGAPHAPQRTHPAETTAALLAALGQP
jgi:pimeloyl-ACP methyl ester carboxylesterase